ncbi:HDIG domain-containing protein [Candidatus Woesebacteria bacterium]|nr:HDIG domain-containing protein [Candidatus Woesebacteria bacterium]
MKIQVPKEVLATVITLENAGFEAHIVGGAVRDVFLQRPTHDWDFTTNAQPEEIQALFPESFYENSFGTVGVAREHIWEQLQSSHVEFAKSDNWVFEITTYRTEGVYRDSRRPEAVEWGKTVQEDLKRRDFTMNAIAFRVTDWKESSSLLENFATAPDEITVTVQVIDPFEGVKAIQEHRIVAVGDPTIRFEEDALRMLRGVRFAAQLQFSIDQMTLIALQKHADRIQNISFERIRDEFLQILVTDNVEDAMTILYTTGLLKHIIPELLETRGIDQRGHHEHDVWLHSLRACQLCPSNDPVVRLAALLHDIAKPETQKPLPHSDGEFSFYNHEVIGARTARDIARRLRLSKKRRPTHFYFGALAHVPLPARYD